ncbi:SIS domain-containing protein [Nocardioides zhouii]|uniref:Glutamine--fructose-6-phosphate aminotransferase [isomerizing] n=1 Tax=Nocardioides zhouii TaxID=1168729 RepID=A0A4V1RMX1_9ACTN|nr:SIS domain-containing protein [Nocardioides zhouii]RYC03837.1 SIS domain-containing protein [Nocardioides zhouii]
MSTDLTPFERDIHAQPVALEDLVGHPLDHDARALLGRSWDRVVLTGMGSSHYVALPTWRALVGAGRAAWAVDTGDLLENPGLLTPDTLLVATSQSGASGEVVELLDRIGRGPGVGATIGVAEDTSSPLAQRADVFVPLRSGSEATVSTKSYLNSLVAQSRITDAFLGRTSTDAVLEATISDVEEVIERTDVSGLGEQVLNLDGVRVAAIGKGDSAATALYAGLITKESSKVPMEGYVGGEFRHGPYELAGIGLTAFLYPGGAPDGDQTLPALARDLVASGATVYAVGGEPMPGVHTLAIPTSSGLSALATGAVVAQLVAVSLARANDVVPGAFLYGSKVTTAL